MSVAVTEKIASAKAQKDALEQEIKEKGAMLYLAPVVGFFGSYDEEDQGLILARKVCAVQADGSMAFSSRVILEYGDDSSHLRRYELQDLVAQWLLLEESIWSLELSSL